MNSLRQALHGWNTKLIYISEEISAKAMFFVEQHFLSHSMQLAELFNRGDRCHLRPADSYGNDKHYKVMGGLEVPEVYPVISFRI